MPLPATIPLIGSGFDALANQRLAWEGFNRGVEEGNIQRAMMADQARNNYFQNLASIQEREATRQAAAQEAAERTALNERQFNVRAQLERENMAAQLRQDAADQRGTLNQIEAFATQMNPVLNDLAQRVTKSEADYTKAETDFHRAASGVNLGFDKNMVDYKRLAGAGMWVVRPGYNLTTEERAKLDKANEAIAQLKAPLDIAERQRKQAQLDFDTLVKRAQVNGLEVGFSKGSWNLFSPRHNRWWYGAAPKQEAKPPTLSYVPPPETDFSGPPTPGTVARQWRNPFWPFGKSETIMVTPEVPAPAAAAAPPAVRRVRVVGPQGQTGSVPEGVPLPAGWTLLES